VTAPETPTPGGLRSRIVGHGDEAPDQLLAHPFNFRRHPNNQREALRGSLTTLGWVKTILVNRTTGHVLDGHARVEEALAAGEPTVPVTYVELSEEEEHLALAVLDPITEMAVRDNDALAALLEGITTDDPGLLELLQDMQAPMAALAEEPPRDEDYTLEPPAEPITKLGDVITIGRHRLVCGDMTDPEVVTLLMEGKRAAAVVTDPPYAVYGSSTGIAADITDDKMVRPFFREIMRRTAEVLKPFGHVYICCDWRSWASWWEVAKGTGIVPKNMIVWDKGGAGLGSNYANAHELLLFGSFVPQRQQMTQKISGMRSVNASNIWRIPRVAAAGSKDGREHNAQKPLQLVTMAIEYSTDPGELVVDFFGGSGTTLIGAEQSDREARLLEISPAYCDVIVNRWQRLTGLTAERA
jgi:DNA modification methylase